MRVPVRMPKVGESITSGVIASWLKKPGDLVARDEPVVSVETDKATVDVPAPAAGRLQGTKAAGAEILIDDVLAEIETDIAAATATDARDQKPGTSAPGPEKREPPPPAPEPAKREPSSDEPPAQEPPAREPPVREPPSGEPPLRADVPLSPAVRRIVEERGLDAAAVAGTGPGGRLLKADVLAAPAPAAAIPQPLPAPAAPPAPAPGPAGARPERVVPMSPLRRRVAERLVQAQSTAAILTTFNEADMSRLMDLRAQMQEAFTKRHGTKLGFMSFFVKACVAALREFPAVNAEIRGTDAVYHDYYDIGIAVGGGKGLVVPVLRDADRLSFAQIEKAIADFGARARDNKLKLEELQGGTFSISNGGVYGSMMSTPILNPPQSGILGMHNIVKRAVVVDDQVVVRPMMYLALSYDHRLVDGREAVSFLVRVKELIERPERLLFDA